MFRFSYTTVQTWMAIALLAATALLPFARLAQAAEMDQAHHMDHGMMSMDCDDGACEDTAAQRCLEHCLQTGATQRETAAVAPQQTELPHGVLARPMFAKATLKQTRTTAQHTGPPQQTERHLTTQKRE